MTPTPGQRAAAEQLKSEGNLLFSKGRYGPAAERYTEAISLDPSIPALYVNRGMCYKKMTGRWEQVAHDAQTALSLSRDNLKAHYLAGVAHRELANLAASISHLTKALEAAREQGDAIKDEIWRELAKAEYTKWSLDSQQRSAAAAALKQQLEELLQAQQQAAGAASQQQQQQREQREQWEQLFQRAAHLDTRVEVPSAYCCPLTMEVMRDPVITPHGFSYERAVLMAHLEKSSFDPINRQALSPGQVVPNIALRNAIQQYLADHPWAWGECS